MGPKFYKRLSLDPSFMNLNPRLQRQVDHHILILGQEKLLQGDYSQLAKQAASLSDYKASIEKNLLSKITPLDPSPSQAATKAFLELPTW